MPYPFLGKLINVQLSSTSGSKRVCDLTGLATHGTRLVLTIVQRSGKAGNYTSWALSAVWAAVATWLNIVLTSVSVSVRS
jgi:hypothetical protein